MWQTWLKLRKGPPTWLSIMSSSFIQLLFYFLMWCIGYITCLIITKNCKLKWKKVAIKSLQVQNVWKSQKKSHFTTLTFFSNKNNLNFRAKINMCNFGENGTILVILKHCANNSSSQSISRLKKFLMCICTPPCQLSLYEKVFRGKRRRPKL